MDALVLFSQDVSIDDVVHVVVDVALLLNHSKLTSTGSTGHSWQIPGGFQAT